MGVAIAAMDRRTPGRYDRSPRMRPLCLLLSAVLLAGGEALEHLPLDPAHAPLPAIRLSLGGADGRHRIGEAVWLQLVVTAGAHPVNLLADGPSTPLAISLSAADGTTVSAAGGPRQGWDGVLRLQPGASLAIPVRARIGRMPSRPGPYRISIFADLGWGPERPADPRRISADLVWEEPPPGAIPGIVDAQFRLDDADHDRMRSAQADLGALARPLFVDELLRRARAGSHRAMLLLGETAGPEAAEALLTIASQLPERWDDLRDGSPANLGFCLFSRLADHLPPRRLPAQAAWWEDPECVWRRETMAGVPTTLLPRARIAALPWIGREDWGVAEILTWSAQPEDRPALLAAIAALARLDPQPSNNLHTMWQYAYAALLAAPDAALPDPAAGVAETMLWACHRRNAGRTADAADIPRHRALLSDRDPLLRRIGLWALPRPVPEALIPDLVPLLHPVAAADVAVTESAIHIVRGTTDPRLLDGLLSAARDPRLFQDHNLSDILAPARRVELATVIAARCKADGRRGDEDFRSFSRLCLMVTPCFLYGSANPTMPTAEQWQAAARQWEEWLAVHGPAIRRDGAVPAGDPRQPDYLLFPNYWFEAADGRRFIRPGTSL